MRYVLIFLLSFSADLANAGITFEPYYSVNSTKSVTPNRSKGTETETIQQREEKGLQAGISFFSIFKWTLSVGQSFHVTKSTNSPIKDEYDELDFSKDFSPNTSTGLARTKKETQNIGRMSVLVDPSFSIFIARVRAGITARQRIVEIYENDVLLKKDNPNPTFKPTATVGAGIRLTPRMYFIAEYGFYFFAFPQKEPFERSLGISYGFSI